MRRPRRSRSSSSTRRSCRPPQRRPKTFAKASRPSSKGATRSSAVASPEQRQDLALLREPVQRLLREDERPAVEHVELPLAPGSGRRVEAVAGELGRETRGPTVVAASDRAVKDLDGHVKSLAALLLRAIGASSPRGHTGRAPEGRLRMRIRLSDAGQLERLLAFLEFDPNVVVTQLGADEVEVSFLGSLNASAQVMESELRLRLWLSSHPDVIAVMQE